MFWYTEACISLYCISNVSKLINIYDVRQFDDWAIVTALGSIYTW